MAESNPYDKLAQELGEIAGRIEAAIGNPLLGEFEKERLKEAMFIVRGNMMQVMIQKDQKRRGV
jgi:hypothetical protein